VWRGGVRGWGGVWGKGLMKPFMAGLPATAAMIIAAAVLGNFGSAGKIAAGAMICLYLMIANCGVAGLVTVVGERLFSPLDSQRPWRATLRGGGALGLASLFSLIRLFVIFPAS